MEKKDVLSLVGILSFLFGVLLLINPGEKIVGSGVAVSSVSVFWIVFVIVGVVLMMAENLEGKIKERSPYPMSRHIRCNTRKEAYELAKKASRPGREPRLHHGTPGELPHYHPNVPARKGKRTPKEVCSHDHYEFPKRYL